MVTEPTWATSTIPVILPGGIGAPVIAATILRKPRPECPVCSRYHIISRRKHLAGTHERVCRRNHRIKWLIRDLRIRWLFRKGWFVKEK